MKMPRVIFLFALLAVGATSYAAECLFPENIDADVGVDVSRTLATVRAPGSATLTDSFGTICYAYTVTATLKIVGDSSTQFVTTVSGNGEFQHMLEAPAQVGSCYESFINAQHGGMTDSDHSGPECWPVPPPPPPPIEICDDPNKTDGTCSPILINLARSPYRLSGKEDPVDCDINADGLPERITWTGRNSDVAFLALDRNANLQIDDGSELFGNWTRLRSGVLAPNGFEALKELDANNDGLVDAVDPIWPLLLLWTDKNHDGISQPEELRPIAMSPVHAIETHYIRTRREDGEGNLFRYKGTAYLHGRKRAIYDVYFQSAQ